jgi:AcrR family transcriptional regulator
MDEKLTRSATSKKRSQQVLAAVDRIAASDRLAFMTTQQVSRQSKISDGVLFRHFSTKEAMQSAWLETRGERLRLLMDGMPAGKPGLMYLIRSLLEDQTLLSLICCQPMDAPYLRQQLLHLRCQLHRLFLSKIELLPDSPIGVEATALADHLMQSLERAWSPDNPQRKQQQERLMQQLPWEKNPEQAQLFPDPEIVSRLALNDSGFVFDPVNGRSFTANDVGLFILKFLQQSNDIAALMVEIRHSFDVDPATAERDLTEFAGQMRKLLS